MLGTGTSGMDAPPSFSTNIDIVRAGGVPSIACLTDPRKECKVCPSAMTKEGEKNFRYMGLGGGADADGTPALR